MRAHRAAREPVKIDSLRIEAGPSHVDASGEFTLPADGGFHTVEIDLTDAEGYEGGMTRIGLAVLQGTGTLKTRRIEFVENLQK